MPTSVYEWPYDENFDFEIGTFQYTAAIDFSSPETYTNSILGYPRKECPECRSNDTEMIIAFGYKPPTFWRCNSCGLQWNGNQVILL